MKPTPPCKYCKNMIWTYNHPGISPLKYRCCKIIYTEIYYPILGNRKEYSYCESARDEQCSKFKPTIWFKILKYFSKTIREDYEC